MIQSDPSKLPHLFAALANATKAFRPIVKNRLVKIKPRDKAEFEFRFADFAELIEATRPALAEHGLTVIQPTADEEGKLYLYTALIHSEGGALVSKIVLNGPAEGVDLKVYGIELSYLRRYHYSAMLCLAADDDIDDDGRAPDPWGDEPARKTPARKTPAGKSAAAPAEASVKSKSEAMQSAGLAAGKLEWIKSKCEALQLTQETREKLFSRHGLLTNLTDMTAEQFAAIRAELMKL